jgi:PEP-CTERM motif
LPLRAAMSAALEENAMHASATQLQRSCFAALAAALCLCALPAASQGQFGQFAYCRNETWVTGVVPEFPFPRTVFLDRGNWERGTTSPGRTTGESLRTGGSEAGVFAIASCEVNLRNATLVADTFVTQRQSGSSFFGGAASASASLGDAIRFTDASGERFAWGDDSRASFAVHVSGRGSWQLEFNLLESGSILAGPSQWDSLGSGASWRFSGSGSNALFEAPSAVDPALDLSYTIVGDESTGFDLLASFNAGHDFDATFTLNARQGSSATAAIDLFAPEGAIATSDSGGFSTAPIPEPQTYVLMGVGLLTLAITARRRRHAP